MSYKVQYGKSLKQEHLIKIRKITDFPVAKWVIISFLSVLVAILARFGYLDFMIPGDREVTKTAFQAMVEDVREGYSMKDAIAAFCGEIIAGAEYTD